MKKLSGIISIQTGLRQAENEKEKNIRLELRSYPTRARKFFKKISKISFWHYFYPNRVEIGQEREKKNFIPNSIPSRPGLENSKSNSKKIQNFKKRNSDNISIQTRLRQADKEKKNIRSEFRSYPIRARKLHKNRKKIQKI